MRTHTLAAEGGRLSPTDLGAINIAKFLERANPQGLVGEDGVARVDSAFAHQNAALFDHLLKTRGRFQIQLTQEDRDLLAQAGIRVDSAQAARFDSFSTGAGLFMARQLEHIFARVLETPYPALNGMTLFPVNTEVAPGARTYTIRRFSDTGEAIIWRAGQTIPRVGMAQEEESRPVRHIASSFAYDIFDRMSANFANIGLEAGLLKTCRKACAQKVNRLVWYGDQAADVWGVLTCRDLQKRAVVTPFDGTADPDDVIAALNAGANWAAQNSKGVFRSDAMLTTERVKNYLMNTKISSGSDYSIGKWWLENNSAGIKEIKTAHELEGTDGGNFPDGTHGILFYKSGDEDAIRLIVPQGFTTLPVQQYGPEFVVIGFQSYGGCYMPDAGHNILLYVTVASD